LLRKIIVLILFCFYPIIFSCSAPGPLNNISQTGTKEFTSNIYRVNFTYPANLKIVKTFANLNELKDSTILLKNDSGNNFQELEDEYLKKAKDFYGQNPVITDYKINQVTLKLIEKKDKTENDISIIIGKYPNPYKYALLEPEVSSFVFIVQSKYLGNLIKTINFNISSKQYLTQVMDIVQEYSIVKDKINWDAWKKLVTDNFEATKDLSGSIKLGLKNLNDNHSSFWSKEFAEAIVNGNDKGIGIDFLPYNGNNIIFIVFPGSPADKAGIKVGDIILANTENPDQSIFLKLKRENQNEEFSVTLIPDNFETNIEPIVKLINNNIAYVELPGSTGDYAYQKYPNIVNEKIKDLLEKYNIDGWIIDLRRNTGGATWPILNAVGPIIGEGNIGSRLDSKGQVFIWKYSAGTIFYGDQIYSKLLDEPFKLKNSSPPVSVLISNTTASAGEGAAIAFKGRAKTWFIGESTNGKTTGNNTFIFNDGSWLNIADSVNIDRNGNKYFAPVKPDLFMNVDWKYFADQDKDQVIKSALEWLKINI
jgi:C-terminal processing protease CtpA/Prc